MLRSIQRAKVHLERWLAETGRFIENLRRDADANLTACVKR